MMPVVTAFVFVLATSAAGASKVPADPTCTEDACDANTNLLHTSAEIHRKGTSGASKKQSQNYRVWFLCKGGHFQAQSAEEKAAGIENANLMKCTNTMVMAELCCAAWKNLTYNNTALLKLDSTQDDSSGGVGFMEQVEGEIVKLCTTGVNGLAVMEEDHAGAATMSTECIDQDFTKEVIEGGFNDTNGELVKPGEAVLRARIMYFIQQGIPPESVPTCAKEVSSCPSGALPTTVSQSWLDGLTSTSVLETFVPLSQQQGRSQQQQQGVNAALLTSGSFTMMAGGSL